MELLNYLSIGESSKGIVLELIKDEVQKCKEKKNLYFGTFFSNYLVNQRGAEDCIVPFCNSHQEYEEKMNGNWMPKRCNENASIWLFLDGSEAISGITLHLLEKLQGRRVSVFYLEKKHSLLTVDELASNQLVKMALQEFAMSGILEHIFLLSQEEMEKHITGFSVLNKQKKIGEFITNIVKNYRYIKNNISLDEKRISFESRCRIKSFGSLYFSEEIPQIEFYHPFKEHSLLQIHIAFYFPEEDIDTNDKYLLLLEETLKKCDTLSNEIPLVKTYQVFSTKSKLPYGFVIGCSNQTQEKNKKPIDI